MTDTVEEVKELIVVKRNGKKVEFDGSKIALAIKKGFDSIVSSDQEEKGERKYSEKDIQKVYQAVLNRIDKEYRDAGKIKIEEIQDMIEEELEKKGYEDVYRSFSEYRDRRNQSRQNFADDKKMHKFLKSLENLGLKSANEEDAKRENANIDGNNASIWSNRIERIC